MIFARTFAAFFVVMTFSSAAGSSTSTSSVSSSSFGDAIALRVSLERAVLLHVAHRVSTSMPARCARRRCGR
jgi:hypothetical protein